MLFRKNKTATEKHTTERLKSTNETLREKNGTHGCSHSYGYLNVRPKNSPLPQECICCMQVVNCLYNTEK